jgi:hypothetical protein
VSRQPVLTLGKASLLMLGIGTVALVGLPEHGGGPTPTGSLSGVVRDAQGAEVAGCRVALFEGAELDLLAWTSSDESGRFAFHESPRSFHVFAAPVREQGLVGSWILDLRRQRFQELEITLRPGREVDVQVRTELGEPIAGAEIRVYDAREHAHVVQRSLSDEQGRASLLVPAATHVGVLGERQGRLSAWAFDRTPAGGETLDFTLPPAHDLTGRVADAEGTPIEGVVVSAWEERDGDWHWNGFRRSDAFGEFVLPGSPEGTWVRAVDPAQGWLPRHERLAAEAWVAHDLLLEEGLPLQIRCTSSQEQATPSRVWIWSQRHHAWSWGSRTDREGELQARVARRHSLVAEPLEPWGEATSSLDRRYEQGQVVLRPTD